MEKLIVDANPILAENSKQKSGGFCHLSVWLSCDVLVSCACEFVTRALLYMETTCGPRN